MSNHINAMVEGYERHSSSTDSLLGRIYWAINTLPAFIQDLIVNNATELPINHGDSDLVDRWQALVAEIDALPPAKEIRKGDWVAEEASGSWDYYVYLYRNLETRDKELVRHYRILRPAPRNWKIGDLLETDDRPPVGTIIRDKNGIIGRLESDGDEGSQWSILGDEEYQHLEFFTEPRILWMPTTDGDES